MSRAFTKEDESDFDELPDRYQSASPNYVTREGLAALRRREEELRQGLASLPKESPRAREARRDLRYFAGRIASAILVEPQAGLAREVRFGAAVDLRLKDGRARRVVIVGQDEAEGSKDKIAWDSVLATALIGAKEGDRVETEEDGALVVEKISY
ncbi:MAG TPA: GreA/GreB family elongation factor [Elusimicrobiota bacterium]|nr:GreA/GreB family elongation factor [Elusimicrobiota bacterium]